MKPRPTVASTASPRRFWWLSLAGLIVALLAWVLWLASRPAPPDSVPETGVSAADSAAVSGDMQTSGGAKIVDDTNAGFDANPLSRIGNERPDASLEPTPAGADTVATAPAVARATRAESTARAPQASASARSTEDADLMATLMQIIGDDDAAQAAARHESMDALIGDILASNQRSEQDTRDALAAIGGDDRPVSRRDAARTRQAGRELAICPAVNTVEGLRCRDRICLRFAGQHPFCPTR